MSKSLREQVFDIMRKYNVEEFNVIDSSIDEVGVGGEIHAYSVNSNGDDFVNLMDDISSVLNNPQDEAGDPDYVLTDLCSYKTNRGTKYVRGVDY